MCLRVEREVAEPLRCSPGGGSVGSSGGGSPLDCPCGGHLDVAELSRRVAELLRRGVGEWIRRGAVVVEV